MARHESAPAEIPPLPGGGQLDHLATILAPLSRIAQPRFYGMQNIPADGSLLAGNHTLYAFLDLPFMLTEIWKRHELAVRSLGENAHYAIPIWRELLTACGMVRGTRENVRALMGEGQTVLVFPGGAREVNKRRGEKYQLMWKERIGFARLAIEHGYPIIPFAAVGAEEMLDIVGEPIETTRFKGRHQIDRAAHTTRDEVKLAVQEGITFLLAEREADPRRGLRTRLLSRNRQDDG